jgi:hypothetical protein
MPQNGTVSVTGGSLTLGAQSYYNNVLPPWANNGTIATIDSPSVVIKTTKTGAGLSANTLPIVSPAIPGNAANLVEPIALVDESDLNHLASPYFVEHVRQSLEETYGAYTLYNSGLKVYTTLNLRMQRAACAMRSLPRLQSQAR